MMTEHTMTFTRNELSCLLDGLESFLEELKWDGGLVLGRDYMLLYNKISEEMGLYAKWNVSEN